MLFIIVIIIIVVVVVTVFAVSAAIAAAYRTILYLISQVFEATTPCSFFIFISCQKKILDSVIQSKKANMQFFNAP